VADAICASVWLVDTEQVSPGEVAAWMALLCPQEQARAASFRSVYDRRDYVSAHALARLALSRNASVLPDAWKFDRSPQGKPVVCPSQAGTPALEFSLSHTRGLVACVVTRGVGIGIDVERPDPKRATHEIAEQYFSPSESAMLQSASIDDRGDRFVELWTLKEAALKAEGEGLAGRLEDYAFAFSGSSSLSMSSSCLGRDGWSFFLGTTPSGCKLAVACRRSTASHLLISIHTLNIHGAAGVQPLRWSGDVRWYFAG